MWQKQSLGSCELRGGRKRGKDTQCRQLRSGDFQLCFHSSCQDHQTFDSHSTKDEGRAALLDASVASSRDYRRPAAGKANVA